MFHPFNETGSEQFFPRSRKFVQGKLNLNLRKPAFGPKEEPFRGTKHCYKLLFKSCMSALINVENQNGQARSPAGPANHVCRSRVWTQ